MESYTEPLGPASGWKDPSNRPVSFKALRVLASGLRAFGAVAHAYAPIYAVGNAFAAEHPEMLMYRGDGEAIRFLDQIVLANPANGTGSVTLCPRTDRLPTRSVSRDSTSTPTAIRALRLTRRARSSTCVLRTSRS